MSNNFSEIEYRIEQCDETIRNSKIICDLPSNYQQNFYDDSFVDVVFNELNDVLVPLLDKTVKYVNISRNYIENLCYQTGQTGQTPGSDDCDYRKIIADILKYCLVCPTNMSGYRLERLRFFRSIANKFFIMPIGTNPSECEMLIGEILNKTRVLKHLLFGPKNLYVFEEYFGRRDNKNKKNKNDEDAWTGRKQQRLEEPEQPQYRDDREEPQYWNKQPQSQCQNDQPKYKDDKASTDSVTNKTKITKESLLRTFKGIDLLLQLANIKTRSGLTYDAFVDWLNEQHEKIGNNGISGPFYKKILGLKKITELSTSSPIDIMEKLPVFAHIFIFFLKCTGKFDVTIVPDKKVNERTFIDLALLEETEIADTMFSNVFREFSVFDLAGLNTHEFEELLSKLDEADSTFIEKFWNIFKKQGVNQAVINAQKSCSNFVVRYFKELKSEEKLDKIAELNLELMKLIFSANNTTAFNSQSAQCFPWITAADAVNALAKPVVKNSLPKPNIDKAKEQMNEVVNITNPLAIKILDWLKTTKTCELSTKLAKLNLNIEQISEVFENLGASCIEDFGELIEDEETVKAIKSELAKCGVKLLQTMLIINALKEEINRSKNL